MLLRIITVGGGERETLLELIQGLVDPTGHEERHPVHRLVKRVDRIDLDGTSRVLDRLVVSPDPPEEVRVERAGLASYNFV